MKILKEPIILVEDKYSLCDLEEFRKNFLVWRTKDIYKNQLAELFEIQNPSLLNTADFEQKKEDFIKERTKTEKNRFRGAWIYFPWSGILLHTLLEKDLFALRTNRNKNLITAEEQEKLSKVCIALAGLSVGSNIASCLVYGGIGSDFKLAEFDCLETSNLNRLRARLDQIGERKIDIVSQQIHEVNPYAKNYFFDEGLTEENLEKFVLEDPKPKVIFEVIDGFEMKIKLRALAKKAGTPVVMVTNLGDGVILDVERYDLDKNTPFFNGRAKEAVDEILNNPDLTDEDKHRYAVSLAGEKNIPLRALDSVKEIGETLVGRPQLASTVTVSGGLCAYIARKILLGEKAPSGSWLIDFDKIFSLDNAGLLS